ncbi:hypothetical protein BDW60DRAFT_146129 [Aspergillus nidulans var. acristatus]
MNLLSILRKSKSTTSASSVYGLDHAVLNLPVPPPSMWMNLGYWKDTTDFPTACAALLDQVLITASLLDENGDANPQPPEKKIRLLDVGIGCGDQSVRILGYKRGTGPGMHRCEAETADQDGAGDAKGAMSPKKPLFDSYVGITSIPVQAQFAKQRVERLEKENSRALSSSSTPSPSKKGEGEGLTPSNRAQVFCADAANPSSWSPELKASLPPAPAQQIEENWLLALDTLYHFSPSRLPLLKYAHSTLHASLMAFDLLLPTPKPSLWTRLILRILCVLTGTPYTNFLTEDEYSALLVEAGYDLSDISFRDISGDVFGGIAGYINSREEVLKGYGLGGSKGMRKFAGAGKIFGWWARTGVVKGVIISARV